MDETELARLEAEVARTARLVLNAAALAEGMVRRPPTPSSSGNVRRLQDAVARGRHHLLEVSTDGAGSARGADLSSGVRS